MKKILTILLVLSTLSVFAENVTGNYSGILNVTVDNTASEPQQRTVVVEDYGSTVKLTIQGFSYGFYYGDVIINATKDNNGKLTNAQISFAFLNPTGTFSENSVIAGNHCYIDLTMSLYGQVIKVQFDGSKPAN